MKSYQYKVTAAAHARLTLSQPVRVEMLTRDAAGLPWNRTDLGVMTNQKLKALRRKCEGSEVLAYNGTHVSR